MGREQIPFRVEGVVPLDRIAPALGQHARVSRTSLWNHWKRGMLLAFAIVLIVCASVLAAAFCVGVMFWLLAAAGGEALSAGFLTHAGLPLGIVLAVILVPCLLSVCLPDAGTAGEPPRGRERHLVPDELLLRRLLKGHAAAVTEQDWRRCA